MPLLLGNAMKKQKFQETGLCVGCESGSGGSHNHQRRGGKLAFAVFLLPKMDAIRQGRRSRNLILEATR
ncbi:hypothetical protein TH468_13805 [Thalassospira sp. MCCC 1A03138]|nr:hypothetical protein TH468_13805 [Thalassospira sp. MCCC 1A03138]